MWCRTWLVCAPLLIAPTGAGAQPPGERKPDAPPAVVPFPRVPPFFQSGDAPTALRTRSIQAVFRGQRIEIQDRGGRDIQMKVTRVVAGRAISESLTAADADALRDQRPEFAALYDRLAGPR